MNMLTNWSELHSEKFQKSALTFRHDLNATGLFTDDALIALLEKHPSEEMDVCAMPLPGDTAFRTGDFRKADGKTLLDICLLYTSPSPRDQRGSRMPSSA